MTVMGNFRKYIRKGMRFDPEPIEGAKMNYTWLEDEDEEGTMLDNLRFSANPDSYQLYAKKDIKRGDKIFVLDKWHWIGDLISKESSKGGYGFNYLG